MPTPFSRTSGPPFARRAARNPTKFAMFPPLTRSPSVAGGIPRSSAIQRTHWPSISEAIGESCQPPTFGFTAEARRSASAPIGAAEDVM